MSSSTINKVAERYWLNKLSGIQNIPVFSDEKFGQSEKSNKATISFVFPEETTKKLKKLTNDSDVAKFIVLLTALRITHYRYTHTESLIFSSGFKNNEESASTGKLLFFRDTPDEKQLVKEIIQGLQKEFYEASDVQHYDENQMLKRFTELTVGDGQALFRLGFHYEGLNEENTYSDRAALFFKLKQQKNIIYLEASYCPYAHIKENVQRFAESYLYVMEQMVTKPNELIAEQIEILSVADKKQLLDEFNNNLMEYDPGKTTIDLFNETVDKIPHKIAVYSYGTSLTYEELNYRSNNVAHYLISSCGVKTGDYVGIMIDRNEWMIVAVMAVLKAGAAYVPIDFSAPAERKEYILKDSGCTYVLTETQHFEELRSFWEGVPLDIKQIKSGRKDNPQINSTNRDSSYVTYTSGSTGRPKGVVQTHECLTNLIRWQVKEGDFPNGMRVLQFASLGFDNSIQEALYAFLSEGTLYLISDDDRKNTERLAEYIIENEVNFIWVPVSVINSIFDDKDESWNKKHQLKYLVSSGEQLNMGPSLMQFLKENPHIRLDNFYGPSETHVVTRFIIKDNQLVKQPIGTPISNTQIYILDKKLRIVPIGVNGEIYIGGAGVAKYYLNLPELTRERFVPDPFNEGAVMYKSGDIATWYANGDIEYMGRNDDQVKIRGNRVELGEVECALINHPEVSEAIVLAQDYSGKGDKELAAYIVLMNDTFELKNLRSFLANSLPDYMIPSFFIKMEKFPLNNNGKVDKKKLPNPLNSVETNQAYHAPKTAIELKLSEIWKEVLGMERIGTSDNFFDLGGHSLKATRVISQVYKKLNVKITLPAIFTNPTIHSLAEVIEQTEKEEYITIKPVDGRSEYPVSNGQKRMWIMCQFENASVAYHMTSVNVFEGNLDVPTLNIAFNQLIARHENLRTTFKINEDGQIYQVIKGLDSIGFNLEYKDLTVEKPDKQKIETQIRDFSTRVFDMKNGPLVRVLVLKTEKQRFILSYVIHHIISDGWSVFVFTKELLAFYYSILNNSEPSLQPLRIQYKDYAVWQQQMLSGSTLKKLRNYWLEQFKQDVPQLELPYDHVRPLVKTYNGAIIQTTINKALTGQFKTILRDSGCTSFMGLVALVNALLYKYTGNEDIVIGSPVAGREHVDLEDQIGYYVNTLPLRVKFKGEESFTQLLSSTKEVTLNAYEHQIYPFDELVNELNLTYDTSRNPIFDVMVVLQNNELITQNDVSEKMGETLVKEYEGMERVISLFDMRFDFREINDEIIALVEYNTDIYNRDRVERLTVHLVELLKSVVNKPNAPLQQLEYVTEEEKNKLLIEFNATSKDYPKDKTMVQLFNEQVSRRPDSISVVHNKAEFSYRELDERSNQISHLLHDDIKLKMESRVGILQTKSEKMIISILGTIKAGGAYVPLDASFPEERLLYMIDDADVDVILTEKKLIELANRLQWKSKKAKQLICMDSLDVYQEMGGGEQCVNEQGFMGLCWINS